MSTMILSQLYIYPIKSCRGLAVHSAMVEARGLCDDRRWMLVNEQGKFITQREVGKLALIAVQRVDRLWRLSAPGMAELLLQEPYADAAIVDVQVWSDTVAARLASEEINVWFSTYLQSETRAVFQHEEMSRPIKEAQASEGDIVSFADGYPLLLIGEASLQDLNSRLNKPVDMRRFRPNLVVSGAAAFAEDDWKKIRIGGLEFDLVKPCSRCVLTTRNPDTGELDPNRDPLRTLSSYRRREGGVMFGQNLIARGRGEIRVGDQLEILA